MSVIATNAARVLARPVAPAVPLCEPAIRGNAWQYVKDCLDTGWVSSVGAYVDRFEREMAEVAGTAHAIATTNGTAALHAALLVAGVEPDDEVLVSTLTFIAPANAIRYAGAWPVFIDAEPDYWQMDVARAIDFLNTECTWRHGALYDRRTGRCVRAVLPVHILGHPVDMDPLLEAARGYGLAVIEDATESLGARYHNRRVGALGDLACFSFNGNKLITTGGGGMIVTDDDDRAQMARYLTTQAKDDPVEFVHGCVGFNYRLTNIQAALGVSQVEQLRAYLAAKHRIAATYDAALGDVPGITPMREATWASSAKWMYAVLVDEARFGMSSRALLRFLADRQIQTRPLWQPIHRSLAHRDARPMECPVAERVNRDALCLPCSVGLTEEQQSRVIEAVREAYGTGRVVGGALQ
ncbi:MAG TPA: LegC family aminotransferase [Gemmatimonadaceae bacterium]|nr:LegC family aminotransferase [Gemmatimonadaceae bacterium]